jgi:osmotically-inducible protein OsmY
LNKADLQLRDAVWQHLEWDSQVDASAIGVTAKEGVVTLTGFVNSYTEKLEAERAAKRVKGVRAVANDVEVRLRLARTDADIATDAARALNLRATLPSGVQAVVHNGHLTLTGTVHTLFQRVVAENAVRHIAGLKGVINHIVVAPAATDTDIVKNIVRAMHREADLDAHGITVTVMGNKALLKGVVRSWHERETAERAAKHGRGITVVENQLTIIPSIDLEDVGEIC